MSILFHILLDKSTTFVGEISAFHHFSWLNPHETIETPMAPGAARPSLCDCGPRDAAGGDQKRRRR